MFLRCLALALSTKAPKGLLVPEADAAWPAHPQTDSRVVLPVRERPSRPGPRTIETPIQFPGGKLCEAGSETGLILVLHFWSAD
jgi:hypothetical protein